MLKPNVHHPHDGWYQGRKVRVLISISTDYHSRDLSVTVGFRMTENKHGDL